MTLPYIYHPEINLGFIKIYTFGLIVAIAFLAGLWFSLKEARRKNIDKNIVQGLIFYILLGGIIGSRLLHIFLNINYYFSDPILFFKFWEGGLTFYGGFIGAAIAAFIYLRKKKLKFFRYADLVTPAIALGHAIGRIACIVGDGGHVGKLTTLPFSVFVNGEFRHLTALYSFVNLIFLFSLLLCLRKKKFFTGFLFLFYICYYAFTRFFIDLLRIDPTFYGLTMTQWIAIPLFFISLGVIIKKMVNKVFFSEKENKFLDKLRTELKGYFSGSIAIKLHMGEPGNKYFLRSGFVKKIVKILQELGVKPFLFDSPVVYPSPRKTVGGYIEVCKKHGYTEDKMGCPVVVSNDFVEQEMIVGKKKIVFQVCKPLVEADGVFILSHVKGHPCSGFGASIKNLGMGALTRRTKGMIHNSGKPVYVSGCNLCGLCAENCPIDNIRYDKKRPFFDKNWCCGCSNCVVVCPQNAIKPKIALFSDLLAAGAFAALKNFKKSFFVNVVKDIAKLCDCEKDGGPIITPDIGYLISKDLAAIDKASYDLIVEKSGKDIFKEIHHVSPLLHIESFVKFSDSYSDYKLIKN